jgi:hypothetical protein
VKDSRIPVFSIFLFSIVVYFITYYQNEYFKKQQNAAIPQL